MDTKRDGITVSHSYRGDKRYTYEVISYRLPVTSVEGQLASAEMHKLGLAPGEYMKYVLRKHFLTQAETPKGKKAK